MKKCTGQYSCNLEKNDEDFGWQNKLKNILKSRCKDCDKKYQQEYYFNNKQKLLDYQYKYYENNFEIISTRNKIYRETHKEETKSYQQEYIKNNKDYKTQYDKKYAQNNKEKLTQYKKSYYEEHRSEISLKGKKYRSENKEKIIKNNENNKENRNKKQKERKKKDPIYRLRTNVSRSINYYLKINNNSKNGRSCLNYLPYTIEELKAHIESQFEDWMTWDNQGKYNSETWDDNDPTTWKWNIDHIIPQSDLPYKSMEDENFKKCWALENLRPLSAKQNIIDGASRVRHNKKVAA